MNKNYIQLVVIKTSFLKVIYRIKNSLLLNVFTDEMASNVDFSNPKLNSIYLAKITEKAEQLGCFFIKLDAANNGLIKFHKNNQHFILGQKILVQVIKEATLPAKLCICSDDLTLTGALVVYKPKGKNIIFSKNLSSQQREEIKAEVVFKEGEGLIIRSLYKHTLLSYLVEEIKELKERYTSFLQQPNLGLIYQTNILENIILGNSKLLPQQIITSDLEEIKFIKEFNHKYHFLNIELLYYTKPQDILQVYTLDEQVEIANSRKYQVDDNLNLIFIEHESFTYIDVDFKGNSYINNTKEEAFYKSNLKLLPIIFQQIMVRNLSGQILIDVLKITNKHYKNHIVQALQDMFIVDENKTSVLGFSNLGLIEISRQKLKDSLRTYNNDSFYLTAFYFIHQLKSIISLDPLVKFNIQANSNELNLLKRIAAYDFQHLEACLSQKITYTINEDLHTPTFNKLP
ncbi:Ribonuclease E/G domain protein [Candidatus Hepatincolaceae symbiont of Richtersius coronifer]